MRPRSEWYGRAASIFIAAAIAACASYTSNSEGDAGVRAGDAGTSSTSSSSSSTSSSSGSTSSSSGDARADSKGNGPCNNASECDDGDPCTTDVCAPSGSCVHTLGSFADSNACTIDACDPAQGVTHTPITACVQASDGCCPAGCSFQNDGDCPSCTNLALAATPDSDSPARGSVDYGPINLNDNFISTNCTKYAWVETAQGVGAAFSYTWTSPVRVASMTLVTDPQAGCSNSGHTVTGGTVEWWDGAAWQVSTTFSGKSGKFAVNLPSPVTTTKVRITNVQVPANGFNPELYEWSIFNQTGCPLP